MHSPPRGNVDADRAARVEVLAARMRQYSGALRPEVWLNVDLTITQLKALLLIKENQPLSLNQLATRLRIAQASASTLVQRLVRLGLVSRRDDPSNRRQLRLEVSAEGEAVIRGIDEASAARTRDAIALMSPEGLAALETALADLTDALERRRAQEGGDGLSVPSDAIIPQKQ